jgi:hypothetical protein
MVNAEFLIDFHSLKQSKGQLKTYRSSYVNCITGCLLSLFSHRWAKDSHCIAVARDNVMKKD